MKLPGKATLATNVIALAFLLFLYVGDLVDYLRAQRAEVSAFGKPPNVLFAALVLAAVTGVLVLLTLKLMQGVEAKNRVFRLLPIVAVVSIFIDLFVLSVDDTLINPADQMSLALQLFGKTASERGTASQVPSTDRDLADIVKEFGAPPYLLRGQPAPAFTIQRRENCEGPVGEAPGAQVGTFLYCVAADKRTAWVTLVALPYEERFGVAKVLSRDGRPMVAIVTPLVPEELDLSEGEADPDVPPFEKLPMLVDGGN